MTVLLRDFRYRGTYRVFSSETVREMSQRMAGRAYLGPHHDPYVLWLLWVRRTLPSLAACKVAAAQSDVMHQVHFTLNCREYVRKHT